MSGWRHWASQLLEWAFALCMEGLLPLGLDLLYLKASSHLRRNRSPVLVTRLIVNACLLLPYFFTVIDPTSIATPDVHLDIDLLTALTHGL